MRKALLCWMTIMVGKKTLFVITPKFVLVSQLAGEDERDYLLREWNDSVVMLALVMTLFLSVGYQRLERC